MPPKKYNTYMKTSSWTIRWTRSGSIGPMENLGTKLTGPFGGEFSSRMIQKDPREKSFKRDLVENHQVTKSRSFHSTVQLLQRLGFFGVFVSVFLEQVTYPTKTEKDKHLQEIPWVGIWEGLIFRG